MPGADDDSATAEPDAEEDAAARSFFGTVTAQRVRTRTTYREELTLTAVRVPRSKLDRGQLNHFIVGLLVICEQTARCG